MELSNKTPEQLYESFVKFNDNKEVSENKLINDCIKFAKFMICCKKVPFLKLRYFNEYRFRFRYLDKKIK